MNTPDRWVIGNWKMNGTLASNRVLLDALIEQVGTAGVVKVAVCPPFPYLAQCHAQLAGSAIRLGAQDTSDRASGAFTGQVGAAMLTELGASLVLVGHSERRHYNAESSDLVAAKAKAAVDAGLTAVICVGETLAEREAGAAETTVAAQLAPCRQLLLDAGADVRSRIVIAYEPVWAIGTGKTASPAEAQAMHAFIRAWLAAIGPAPAGVSVLYGGSVKAANAAELFAQPDIDGGLIGGAALVASDFLAIIAAAQ